MKQPVTVISTLAAVACGAILVPAAALSHSARRKAITSGSEFQTCRAQATELAQLQVSAPAWISRESPEGALAPKVSAVLAQIGLPASALQSLSGDSAPVAVSGASAQMPAKRRRAGLTLANLTLPQLGKFLSAWRTASPAWTVTSIEVAPEITGTGGGKGAREIGAAGGDLPLRVVLSLETVYLDRPAQATPRPITSALQSAPKAPQGTRR